MRRDVVFLLSFLSFLLETIVIIIIYRAMSIVANMRFVKLFYELAHEHEQPDIVQSSVCVFVSACVRR